MKFTIYGQVKKIKEAEYLCRGSLCLAELIQLIEKECIEVGMMRDPNIPCFFQIENFLYCFEKDVKALKE